jgi:S1-C subfamily serine protease
LLNLRNAVIFLAACLLLPTAAFAVEPSALERMGSSVFRIQATDAYGRVNFGSGVLVAPHTLVTNCHVVLNTRDINVASPTGRIPARIVRAHAERDLCLLDAPGLEGTAVTIGNTMDKRAGEAITAVGYPAGAALNVSHGSIEGLHTYQGNGRVVQGSAFFDPGKSGGGLFDHSGQLIGILTFKLRAGGPYHFAVPAEWVEILLRDLSGTAQAAAGKPFWQYADERQPLFVRAASLSAEGNCAALNTLTSQRLAREPGNPEAVFMANRAQRCNTGAPVARPLLEKIITALLRN